MLKTILNGIGRLAAILKGGADRVVVPAESESQASRIPVGALSTPSSESSEAVVDLSRWTITEHVESPFEKVGRIYLVGPDMVIRSDLDSRGFQVPLDDVDAVLAKIPQDIRLLKTGKKVGTVQLSTSGRAMNFAIEPFFYTTPLHSLTRMLAGEQRKAPLFVGREQVGGN
ncbi:MAG TPA: hypothetical protein PLM60_04575 [Methanoregulaceae archaeon]|nr:hypothetical protein [Methanoregulaceae archaeon]HPS22664.1 hypothetical protein [Methanoregulaceae archaeon]